MGILHKIAARIYCGLVTELEMKVDPPLWLFNRPSERLPWTYAETIRADINFIPKERVLIEEAARNIEWFCNGLLTIKVDFDWDPARYIPEKSSIMLRVPASDKTIVDADGYYKNTVLGLCSWTNKKSTIIHLVHDRLKNEQTFRTTALHELGHYLGMGHTQKPSIMYKANYTGVLYMTHKDAVELGKCLKLDPEKLRYFKL